LVGALFGGPWICAATVRAVSHTAALTVMSTTHAPGESPKIVAVKDQRLTAFAVSVLLGISVLLSPVLKLVPFAVLFGVFLYMGQSGMNGVQFFDRLWLFIKPTKHHPEVSYVRQVKTWRMNLFTFCQLLGLVVLWIVKSSAAALAFPFFVVAMVPYRMCLKWIFNQRELKALDGPDAGKNIDGAEDDEDDFFTAAAGLPALVTAMPFMNTAISHSQKVSFVEQSNAPQPTPNKDMDNGRS
jgi:solute carrier family 4 anion exchanger 2